MQLFNYRKNISLFLTIFLQDYAVKRGQEVEKGVRKVCSELRSQMQISKKLVKKSLKDAAQDFEPLFQWYESQLPIKIRKFYDLIFKAVFKELFLFFAFYLARNSGLQEENQPSESLLVTFVGSTNKGLKCDADAITQFLERTASTPSIPREERFEVSEIQACSQSN